MSEALACDTCGAVAVRGDAINRSWVEIARIGEPQRLGRRLLPPDAIAGLHDPLGGRRHFCSLGCASAWISRRAEEADAGTVAGTSPLEAISARSELPEGSADAAGRGPRRLSEVLSGIKPEADLRQLLEGNHPGNGDPSASG